MAEHRCSVLLLVLYLVAPSVGSTGCDDAQPLHAVCYLSQDIQFNNATIECLRNNNLNSTTCSVNAMDEHPCTLPLEYNRRLLGYGYHFVDVKFTDDCGQVEMERVYFEFSYDNIVLGPGTGDMPNCNEGDVRLVGGATQTSGRVEVCAVNEWGTVCSDEWDDIDAAVICRQLGYFGNAEALEPTDLVYNAVSGSILLDEVSCTGVESQLLECTHGGIGVHDCSHYQDAGARCTGITVRFDKTEYHTSESEGYVEVCTELYIPRGRSPTSFNLTVSLGFSQGSSQFNDFEVQCDNTLHFTETDQIQCFNVTLYDDDICEYNSDEYFRMQIVVVDGSSAVDIDQEYGHAIVYIDDSLEPECAVQISYEKTAYTATERDREVEICILVTEAPVPAKFSVFVHKPLDNLSVTGNWEYITSNFIRYLEVDLTTNGTLPKWCYEVTFVRSADCSNSTLSSLAKFEVYPLTLFTSSSRTDIFIEACEIIRVGFNTTSVSVEEGTGIVTLYVVVLSGEHFRAFNISVYTLNNTADSNDFEAISGQVLSFTALDSEQCFNVSITDDSECEIVEDCENEMFTCALEPLEDSRVIAVDSFAYVYIQDGDDCEKMMNSSCTPGSPDLRINILKATVPNAMMMLSPTVSKATVPNAMMMPSPTVTLMDEPSPSTAPLVWVVVLVVGLVTCVTIAMAGMTLFIVCKKNEKQQVTECAKSSEEDDFDVPTHCVTIDDTRRSSIDELQETLPRNMVFTSHQIRLSNTVGQGESGLVYKAYLSSGGENQMVAVKTGKELYSEVEAKKLMKELTTMLSFDHPNVLSLIGMCLDRKAPLIIMPFMSNGSVLDYVRQHKQELFLCTENSDTEVAIAKKMLLGICHQIAKGMKYLADNRFVHRDLAARNCMINANSVIKVADFGLTEDMYGTNYFRRRKSETGSEEKVPIRWMAPESIENDIYNQSTDVWSFGVTVWEIFTCGRVPYSGVPAMSLVKLLREGQRLERPDSAACVDEIYEIMILCWNVDPQERPRFSKLVNNFNDLLEQDADYLELSRSLSCKEKHFPSYTSLAESGLGDDCTGAKDRRDELEIRTCSLTH